VTEQGTRPLLNVVRGEATTEETAALVAALAISHATGAARHAAARARASSRVTSAWCDRSRLVRGQLAHGQGAWRASALPR